MSKALGASPVFLQWTCLWVSAPATSMINGGMAAAQLTGGDILSTTASGNARVQQVLQVHHAGRSLIFVENNESADLVFFHNTHGSSG